MAKKRAGRKKGGHNRGFFFRKGRGWYVLDDQKQIPLRDQNELHITDEKANNDLLKDAYARWRTHRKEEIEEKKRLARRASSQHSVYDACKTYLYHVQVNGAQKTLTDRMDTLFDLCWGVPPEYRQEKTFDPKKMTKEEKREAEAKRFHDGYGHLPAMSLTFTHIDQWIASHDNWGRGGIPSIWSNAKAAFIVTRGTPYGRTSPRRLHRRQETALLIHGLQCSRQLDGLAMTGRMTCFHFGLPPTARRRSNGISHRFPRAERLSSRRT
ncbi:MAG: hypothetical protein GXX96_26630 [Planctomycetaceae bacterium]|nr:hypothetical protein [Planctomycetaceae bacterium]